MDNTEGFHCEKCKKGYYGDATQGTNYDCKQCPCPGQAECYLDPVTNQPASAPLSLSHHATAWLPYLCHLRLAASRL